MGEDLDVPEDELLDELSDFTSEENDNEFKKISDNILDFPLFVQLVANGDVDTAEMNIFQVEEQIFSVGNLVQKLITYFQNCNTDSFCKCIKTLVNIIEPLRAYTIQKKLQKIKSKFFK